jgi:hypothetical protein
MVWAPLQGQAQTPPVAEAGLSRYAAANPIVLNGTGSSDPDGDRIIGYRWFQVSGPEIEITENDTATPEISGFAPGQIFQTIEIGLVVSDGVLESATDLVEITVVPSITDATMSLVNPPFRPELPTLITFGGGDCVDGIHMPLDDTWQALANIVTGPYFHPYVDQAFHAVVLLSELAPDYRQPIQTVGFSTGGNAAAAVANIINQFIRDPRYAVNRMTLLDSYCLDDFDQMIAEFSDNPVAGEPAWAEVYRSLPEPIGRALNVSFYPGGVHNTPLEWFLASADPNQWPDGDLYHRGVTAGYFVSVAGPAHTMQLATEDLTYYFECPEVAVGCLQLRDGVNYPGMIPEPVRLIGPSDGDSLPPIGAVLTCEPSEHAVAYELLVGSDPGDLTMRLSETSNPPTELIDELPFTPTYWTIRVRDAFGSTTFASPRELRPARPLSVRRARRNVQPVP